MTLKPGNAEPQLGENEKKQAKLGRGAPGIPAGYKQTEVGVIPVEWEVRPISQIVERLEAGVSVNSVDDDLTSCAQSHAVLKTSAVTEGRFLPHECKKIAPRDLSRVSLRPRCNTIIISRMNTPTLVGECGYVDTDHENLFLPDRLWMTKQRSGSESSIRWLAYLLSSKPQKDRIKELATGTSGSMKNLAKGSLLELKIAVPPPPEQRAIATALSDVDALLAALDRLIAKKRDLKQAAMQQLLTGHTRLPGFHCSRAGQPIYKQTEVGMIPEDWEVRSVRDIGQIKTGPFGTLLKADEYAGVEGVPLISVGEVGAGIFKVTEHTPRVPDIVIRRLPQYVLRAGDIVFGRKGAVDRSALVTEAEDGWFLGSDGISIRPQRSCYPPYLACQFQRHEVQAWLIKNAIGTTMASLNQRILNRVQIPYASLPEQTAIAEVLTDMDAELATLEQRRDKTRALKQGMMQELLTGRTRLV